MNLAREAAYSPKTALAPWKVTGTSGCFFKSAQVGSAIFIYTKSHRVIQNRSTVFSSS